MQCGTGGCCWEHSISEEYARLLVAYPAEVPDHHSPVSATAGKDGLVLGAPTNLAGNMGNNMGSQHANDSLGQH
jgi:hypothetical protein